MYKYKIWFKDDTTIIIQFKYYESLKDFINSNYDKIQAYTQWNK